jgi:hypothetical protein
MTSRRYLLNDCDRISSVIEIHAFSNADAIQQARSCAQPQREAFELWHGHAVICRKTKIGLMSGSGEKLPFAFRPLTDRKRTRG